MKKKIILAAVYLLLSLGIMLGISTLQYRNYMENYNGRINAICSRLIKQYPQITQAELKEILQSSEKEKWMWDKYGIDLKVDSIIQPNQDAFRTNMVVDSIILILWCGLTIVFVAKQGLDNRKNLRKITGYLEKINKKDYSFDMNHMGEGDQSILENEVYKTTIMLKESAEQSRTDKENLKDSLSDISHQLKTPLTSLTINLDNMQNHPDMDEATRKRIIANARRDVSKMAKMVQQLLTLSRLDANVVIFSREENKIHDIIYEAMEDVEALAELLGIDMVYKPDPDQMQAIIECDRYWEVQAVGNILKNGIEHAASRVTVSINACGLYNEIIVENDGEPISKEDRDKIFERFYQGDNPSQNSVGIGLSLANIIVGKDNGYIVVESDQAGTRFIIRYV